MRGCLAAKRRPDDPEAKFMHTDVHQDYIQTAAEYGLPALILYLALLAYLFWLGSKAIRNLAPDDPQKIYRLALMAGALAWYAERRLDRGWVYLFASTADTAWNELPIRPAFVPLLSHLTGRILKGADDALHLKAGGAFDYPLPAAFAGKPSVIYPLDAGQTKGVQRPAGATLHFTNTLTAGAYEASVAEPPLRLLFAVQPALEESGTDTLSSAQLETLRGSAKVVSWTPGMKLGDILSSQRSGAELWKLLLVGVLALAVTEIFLAQGFSRSK